jgi:hypothetical protein
LAVLAFSQKHRMERAAASLKTHMPQFKSSYGGFLFSVRITDRTLRYLFARRIVLAEIPFEEMLVCDYAGQGSTLKLRNGRLLKLRGINLDEFATLTSEIRDSNARHALEVGFG